MTSIFDGLPAGRLTLAGLTPEQENAQAGVLRAVAEALAPGDAADAGFLSVKAQGSTTSRSLAARALDTLNVLDFGARGDGTTDDSVAFLAAANAASVATAAGKSAVVFVPGGRTYVAQGIPLRSRLYWKSDGAILQHPASPSASLFLADAVADFFGGGVEGFEMSGATLVYDAVDFGPVSNELNDFYVAHNYIHGFRHGFHGAARDRFVPLYNNRIWVCTVGIYIRLEHPNIGVNDIRSCDTGVGGNIVHLQFTGTKLNYNQYGIRSLDGGSVGECQFVGCHFYGNVVTGAKVDERNQFVGCYFDATPVGIDSYGEVLASACFFRNCGQAANTHAPAVFTGCHFSGGTRGPVGMATGLQVHASRFNGLAQTCVGYEMTAARENLVVEGCIFEHSGTGPAISITATTPGTTLRYLKVRGNTFNLRSDVRALYVPTADLIHAEVTGNTAYAQAAQTGYTFSLGSASSGYIFQGNTFFSEGATPVGALQAGNSIRSVIAGNRFRNFGTAPLNLGTTDADTRVRDNLGFVTDAGGTATVAAASTTATVTHGLARTPSAQGITLTPTGSLGTAVRFWVSGITATQFTLNVDVAPGGSGAAFAWQASAVRG